MFLHWKYEWMKRKTVVASTFLVSFCGCVLAQSNTALASEFWADKRGGGAEEVLLHSLVTDKYEESFRQDIALPGTNGSYIIFADAPAKLLLPFTAVGVQVRSANMADISAARVEQQTAEDGSFDIEVGEWVVTPDTSSRRPASNVVQSSDQGASFDEAYVQYGDNAHALIVTKQERATEKGTQLTITASTKSADSRTVLKKANVVATAYLKGRVVKTIKLTDDGRTAAGDVAKGDGVFSASMALEQSGDYSVLIDSTATDGRQEISRATVVRSAVGPSRLVVGNPVTVTQGYVGSVVLEEERYGIEVDVNLVKGAMPDVVDTYAEVWAKDAQGSDAAVGWVGGLVKPYKSTAGRWIVPFTFHSGWLKNDQFQGPLSLRNTSVRDIDMNDSVLVVNNKARSIDLPIDPVPIVSQSTNDASGDRETLDPTRAMQVGVHPSVLENSNSTSVQMRAGTLTGSDKIVLSLHGFCDGGKSLNSFSSTVKNKGYVYTGSRSGQSADRYAIDVMQQFGYPAGKVRGIVAHSHGGMAAASLLDNFSYFFADNASSRPPNVVSMGTPYHGTSLLEGRLPGWVENGLISLFQHATGCTIPRELYPSTNASWNNSIGWRARLQISSWYTTHTKPPNVFENRDCRDSLSAQIPGSDDGVLAPRNGLGFADGGEYDLHYSGYCHMSGMGQGDQWQNPSFISHVNNLFHAQTEVWQPF